MPTTELADEDFSEEGTIDLISMLVKAGMVPTRSEGRRAIEQGGVSIDGEKITDVKYTVAKDALTGEGVVLKKDKKKFNKVLAGTYSCSRRDLSTRSEEHTSARMQGFLLLCLTGFLPISPSHQSLLRDGM